MAWDEAKKARAVALYTEAEPTPENSMEIVAEVAEQLEETPNGVRMILTREGVYVKKESSKASGESKTTKSASTRVSKEEAQNQLTQAIEAAGKNVDSDIISKLTGKAALYFVGLLT